MTRFFLTFFLLLGSVPAAFACSCAPPPPNLHLITPRDWAEWRWQSAQTVFEGKVENIQLLGWPLQPEPGRAVRTEIGVLVSFSNARFYRGQSHEKVQVETGLGRGDCGYPFKVGQSYVVDAETNPSGRMTTGICNATNLLEFSGAALRFLRGDPPLPEDLAAVPNEHSFRQHEQPSSGKICGKVSFPPGANPQTVELRVWPTGGDERSFLGADDVESESNGSFCFADLDPGDYIVGAAEADSADSNFRYVGYYPGIAQRSHAAAIEVKPDGVARIEFALTRQQLYVVRGFLRGAAAISPASLQVMLAPEEFELFGVVEPTQPGPDGAFEFDGVPPGRYTAVAIKETDPHSITFLSSSVSLDIKSNIDGLRLNAVLAK